MAEQKKPLTFAQNLKMSAVLSATGIATYFGLSLVCNRDPIGHTPAVENSRLEKMASEAPAEPSEEDDRTPVGYSVALAALVLLGGTAFMSHYMKKPFALYQLYQWCANRGKAK